MKLFIPLILLIIVSTACNNEIETIRVQRDGILTFYVQGDTKPWRSSSFMFYPGQSIVKELLVDNVDISVLFRRYYLVFGGLTSDNRNFELTITLDIADQSDMIHNYTTTYNRRKGGLSEISLIIIEKGAPEKYAVAELCPDKSNVAYFDIERQNTVEELIAGSMGADLCYSLFPDSVLHIYNAQFKDIQYTLPDE